MAGGGPVLNPERDPKGGMPETLACAATAVDLRSTGCNHDTSAQPAKDRYTRTGSATCRPP